MEIEAYKIAFGVGATICAVSAEINIDTHILKTHKAIIQSSENEKVALVD